ncbi:MAG: hypothetical protein ACYDBJ_26275 [Aggregatilineales bacterium]
MNSRKGRDVLWLVVCLLFTGFHEAAVAQPDSSPVWVYAVFTTSNNYDVVRTDVSGTVPTPDLSSDSN